VTSLRRPYPAFSRGEVRARRRVEELLRGTWGVRRFRTASPGHPVPRPEDRPRQIGLRWSNLAGWNSFPAAAASSDPPRSRLRGGSLRQLGLEVPQGQLFGAGHSLASNCRCSTKRYVLSAPAPAWMRHGAVTIGCPSIGAACSSNLARLGFRRSAKPLRLQALPNPAPSADFPCIGPVSRRALLAPVGGKAVELLS